MQMAPAQKITTLFLDIGGVLLSDGWDRGSRLQASTQFNLDRPSLEERHHLIFDTYELGKITLDEYLKSVVFYEPRPFTYLDFKKFMFAQSTAFPEMIKLFHELKKKYCLKVVVVSNEGRELNAERIKEFKLRETVDFFLSSCFVHLHKPDNDIFQLALDLSQEPVENILYIDDQLMFVEFALNLGMKGLHHTDLYSTIHKLKMFGLQTDPAIY